MNNQLNLLANLTIEDLANEATTSLQNIRSQIPHEQAGRASANHEDGRELKETYQVENLRSTNSNMPTLAFDSTCITASRTKTHIILAARTTAVKREGDGSRRYHRWGPIFLTKKQQYVGLTHFGVFDKADLQPNWLEEIVQRRIRNTLELHLLRSAIDSLEDGLIILDGYPLSLINGVQFHHALRRVRKPPSAIIGVSKTTSLESFAPACEILEKNTCTPCCAEIGRQEAYSGSLCWRTFVVKFSRLGLPLRVDVLVGETDPVDALGLLAGSDVLASGYPETLRLAHHLSVFTSLEVTGMRTLIQAKSGEKEIFSWGDRRLALLGSMHVRRRVEV